MWSTELLFVSLAACFETSFLRHANKDASPLERCLSPGAWIASSPTLRCCAGPACWQSGAGWYWGGSWSLGGLDLPHRRWGGTGRWLCQRRTRTWAQVAAAWPRQPCTLPPSLPKTRWCCWLWPASHLSREEVKTTLIRRQFRPWDLGINDLIIRKTAVSHSKCVIMEGAKPCAIWALESPIGRHTDTYIKLWHATDQSVKSSFLLCASDMSVTWIFENVPGLWKQRVSQCICSSSSWPGAAGSPFRTSCAVFPAKSPKLSVLLHALAICKASHCLCELLQTCQAFEQGCITDSL